MCKANNVMDLSLFENKVCPLCDNKLTFFIDKNESLFIKDFSIEDHYISFFKKNNKLFTYSDMFENLRSDTYIFNICNTKAINNKYGGYEINVYDACYLSSSYDIQHDSKKIVMETECFTISHENDYFYIMKDFEFNETIIRHYNAVADLNSIPVINTIKLDFIDTSLVLSKNNTNLIKELKSLIMMS